ncbi:MAG: hypothetical protein IKL18_02255 [Oscillospiraceae bacterium]|nr:hypothetical protein [Oscillospiraceae bacterium]MBR6656978.1 hypothetical protein [Oscillospiraceae bacterium]
MAEIIKITDRISYIEATEKPLSADVGIVEGDEFIWLFDIGADESVPISLNKIQKPKNAVISHFYPDHMGNLEHVNLNEIYLGANTFKYANRGTIVAEDIFFDDGVKIHVFPLPSSHAKGSVGMEIGDYAFLGDATYATMKQGRVCYNASVLKEEIAVLKKLSAKFFLISHDEKFIRPKEEILAELEVIYKKRNPKESFIWI